MSDMDHPPIRHCNACPVYGFDKDDDGPMRKCIACEDWYCVACLKNGA